MLRRAFTLIELLVVIGLIALLVGLLMPAVQRVRGAAARVKCANNLRQIGLALHQHHDARGRFPPGLTTDRPGESLPRLAWPVRLYPFLEQDVLWHQAEAAYRANRNPFDPPHPGFGTPVSIFACPADNRAQEVQPTYQGYRPALTSYVGVLGTDFALSDGVLYADSRTRVKDILDGTSQTIMVAERPPSSDIWYGWLYAGVGQSGSGSPDMLLGARDLNLGALFATGCPRGPYHFTNGRVFEQCDVFHYWSLHSGGAHFLFADGSVRFLSYSADPIMPGLATRMGSEKVVIPE